MNVRFLRKFRINSSDIEKQVLLMPVNNIIDAYILLLNKKKKEMVGIIDIEGIWENKKNQLFEKFDGKLKMLFKFDGAI